MQRHRTSEPRAIRSVTVEVIQCPACARRVHEREALRQVAQTVLGERLTWRETNVIDDLDHAVSLGVLTLPSVAIDGRLAFSSLPTAEQLRRALEQLLPRC